MTKVKRKYFVLLANMSKEIIDIEKIYNHWLKTSDKDFDTMMHLYQAKDYHGLITLKF